jgi:uncharacterized FAD-dependent dehydrogenase
MSMLRIDNIKIYEDLSEEEVINKALKKSKIAKEDVLEAKIVKKSIDARDKKNVHYSYSFDVLVKNESRYPYLKQIPAPEKEIINKKRKSVYKPVIVGSGPAGLFCALKLVEYGYEPIILEQGSKVEERIKYIDEYKSTGHLNELCNVQFGEGGAGTFSDGKLTTGINSPLIKEVLETFYKFGAPKEITYLSHPHIGTDNLIKILKNIREYVESKGGKYHFNTKLININKENDVYLLETNNQQFSTDCLVLAIGHSARDTYKMLLDKNITMNRKNFSVGVRIEHKQKMINESQYGNITKLNLPPAEYKLAYHNDERSCYTFCMCPGGEVIASSSEKEAIVTNGMSEFKRDKENANAALLVNVLTTDFTGTDPLAGMYFQEELEHHAYILGGSNGYAPVQRVEDYLNNKISKYVGEIIPSYKPGYTLTNLNELFPDYINKTLKEGILSFDRKIKGFANPDAILTGVETRSSAPVTITRNEDLECNLPGIYPCGEGAGYAGGITSSAIDGIKVAIKIIEKE